MRAIFSLILLCISLAAAAVQPPVMWSAALQAPAGGAAAVGCDGCVSDQRAMAIDAAGNVIVAGYMLDGAGNYDFKTVKFSAAGGTVLWDKTFDSAVGGSFDQAWALALDAAGNAIVTGYAWNGADSDIKTIKYASADGALVWEKVSPGAPGGNDFGIVVGIDGAGNAIVSGSVWNGANDDMRTIKYAAADGAVLWEKTFAGAAGGNEYVFAIAIDAAGNAIVTGESHNALFDFDWKTIKYAAANGAVLWEKTFTGAGNGDDVAYAVAIDGAGNAVIAGYQTNAGLFDWKTIKYAAADGAILWEKTFAGAGGGDDIAYSLALDASGNAIVTGFSFSGTDNDWKTIKYAASDGALLWERTFAGTGGGSDVAPAIAIDSFGNAIVGGRVFDGVDRNMQAVKYAGATGLTLWEYAYAGSAGGFDRVAAVATSGANVVIAGESTESGFGLGWRVIKLQGTTAPFDLNADARPDIVWSNTANGATFYWYMNGPVLASDAYVTQVDPAWKIQGIADFNGDGHPDLVWRNTDNGNTYVWYMNGTTFLADALLFSLPPEWVIQGVADFNGDGHPDFLMRNSSTGVAFVWFFNDNAATADQFLFGIDPVWKVEQVGDMNGDNQPDLLFRNMSSGLAFAWYTQYSGGTLSLADSSAPMFAIDPVWEIVQLADWNGDGNPDLLFRNRDSGVVFAWYMTGTTLQGSDFITQIDPTWEIVPRR